jgi:predicted nucleotidyltransferase
LKTPISQKLDMDALVKVLSENDSVVFAYIYGSVLAGDGVNDIDIAVFAKTDADPNQLSADLKVSLHNKTSLPPDVFDVRILNAVSEHGDIFGLLYLKHVLEDGKILVDKDPGDRAAFLEHYGLRFRECEGLIQEVLE